MVDAVVSFVARRLGDLLIEQVILLRGVKDDVERLKDQLEYIRCFLKDAEEKQDVDNRMRKWISDVRDVAYEAEDIIDNFILKVETQTPKKMGLKDCFQKYFCFCSKCSCLIEQANLYGLRGEINKVNTKLTQIQQNQVNFGIKSIDDARERSDHVSITDNWLRRECPYKDNEHVIGFKEDVDTLMSELVKEVKDRYVISIVGIGGLGKTTVARKLYNTLHLKKIFDCDAWVFVSTDYKIQDLLRSIVKSFKRPTTKEELEFLEKMKEEDLESHLRETLRGRRYLVVLDDVWDVKAWPCLIRAFPDEKNGSRVIMTTRNKDVAQPSNERTYVHELSFLKEGESWELFSSKAFPNYDEVENKKSYCPPGLESLAKEMVNKCRGLPLAIVVLGGLLRKKDLTEWPKLKDHMWSHIRGHDSNHVQAILAQSFKDLPYCLKSCFLYLGLFPEDFEIYPDELCRLWVAEGFIKPGKESVEEEAEAYLRELIDRSLVQVAGWNWRRITGCRVHDLLRDFAIEKSKELNFLHIYEGTVAPDSRRLACYSKIETLVSLDHADMHLRTLLFYNLEDQDMEIALLQRLCRNMRLMRVLDIQCSSSKQMCQKTEEERLPDDIGKLIHLRYLRLRGLNMEAIPQFIGSLHGLQTLDLHTSHPIQLPDQICNAKQLRHLIGHFKWPFQVDNLKNLRTLKMVYVEDQMEFSPRELINLRKLSVSYGGNKVYKDNNITLDSIGGLRSLQTLHIGVRKGDADRIPEVHLSPLSRCQHLLQLRLICSTPVHWKLPTEVLPNLRYLCFDAEGVSEDPMPILEMFPKLAILVLVKYRGQKIVCTAGGFLQLEILHLYRCSNLKGIQVEGGGMPVLKGLLIEACNDVLMPDRLRDIPAPPIPVERFGWAY